MRASPHAASAPPFAPNRFGIDTFRFGVPVLRGRRLALPYRLEAGGRLVHELEETLDLPEALSEPDPRDPAIARAIRDVHRVCGVSYWKTFCPRAIDFEDQPPSPSEASFWSEIYTLGLGEFFFRNDIALSPPLEFPMATDAAPRPRSPALDPERVLLLIGGGKDSAVSREIVRASGRSADLLSLGLPASSRRLAAAMGDRLLVVGRQLDPRIGELNRSGAYNGHVPFSAIVAFIARLVALAGGYGAVIASNERSSSAGNLTWHGLSINHQWSKGIAFERAFRAYTGPDRLGGADYFSLLRPLSELVIGRLFAAHERYFEVVSSCNAVTVSRSESERWCGACAKCVFVSIILAPFVSDEGYGRIFPARFFELESNAGLVRSLLDLEGHKPFDCVGTPGETAAALLLLARSGRLARGSWLDELVASGSIFPNADPEALLRDELAPSSEHCLPPAWERALRAAL